MSTPAEVFDCVHCGDGDALRDGDACAYCGLVATASPSLDPRLRLDREPEQAEGSPPTRT